jgi:CBS domain-containing protein
MEEAMQVFEAMTPEVVSVLPQTRIIDAALVMKGLDVGPLPVVVGCRLVGVITDRDIAVRATANGLDPRTTEVDDVMTRQVVACHEDDDVRTAARLMQDAQVRRLPVVDQAGDLAGIVSLADLALQVGDDELCGETLGRVSEPFSRLR